jgi:hypothetical protein
MDSNAIPAVDAAILQAFAGPHCSIEVVMISEDSYTPPRGRKWRYAGHDLATARDLASWRQNPAVYVRKDGQWTPA